MAFAAAIRTKPQTPDAIAEVCAELTPKIEGTPQLGLVFFSNHHLHNAEQIAASLTARFASPCLLGCPGEAIVGPRQEIEDSPALSVWLGHWPTPVAPHPFHLTWERTPEGPSILGWPDALGDARLARSTVLLLA